MTNDDSPAEAVALDRDQAPGRLVFAAFIGLATVVFGIVALQMDGRRAVWPRILLAILFLLVVVEVWRQVTLLRQKAADEGSEVAAVLLGPWRTLASEQKARLLASAWLVLFAAVGVQVGFGWATLVFVPIYQVVSGQRNPVAIVLLTAGLALAIHFLFGELASTPIW